ncbi:tyrosine-type recombinase/integrase [Aureimonas sp. N4]|uniref:tyrosine-type recombinase/integrase n=1 Tax=Aureimonas sp. N4 TaxID=1638165 RepID=UPI00078483D8|nr:tyrosine-type recombinase/integrase [Aureimonas sp. N4]
MPREQKPARLWLRPARKGKGGKGGRPAVYVILDAGKQHSTGCGAGDRDAAEKAYAAYVLSKATKAVVRQSKRRPAHEVTIAEVLARYMTVKKDTLARPEELGQSVERLLDFFGEGTCEDISTVTCAEFVRSRTGVPWKSAKPERTGNAPRLTTSAGALRDLQNLRAAINVAVKDKILSEVVHVEMPEENAGREEWLTVEQVERMCTIARETLEQQRRHRGAMKGQTLPTKKRPLAHIERFIRVAVQTGTRTSAVCQASFVREPGRPWVDLENGLFYRKPPGTVDKKNKKYPPAPLAPSLVEELTAWRDGGSKYVVELHGKPVNCRTGYERVVEIAALEMHIVRHSLRHTAATWMMQDGVDLAEAAGYLGMTVETLMKRYAHHHPAHQRKAAAALAKRMNRANASPTIPKENGVSEGNEKELEPL